MDWLDATLKSVKDACKQIGCTIKDAYEVLREELFPKVQSCAEEMERLEEAFWKRQKQLEISQAGWEEPAPLIISDRAEGVRSCCTETMMRRSTSATGE